jgi:outer membrane protein assembly factor BamB
MLPVAFITLAVAVILVIVLPVTLVHRHHGTGTATAAGASSSGKPASSSNPSSSNPSNSTANITIDTTYPPNREDWTGWGANIYNNFWASANTVINSTTIPSLTQHCHIEYTTGGVSASPVVSGNIVYYPTWNGLFVALDYTTCKVKWETNVTTIIASHAPINAVSTTICQAVSRTSPQLDGEVLYFGTQRGALLVALSVDTGDFKAAIQLNSHPAAIITMSPTLYNGKIYVGAASQEEIANQYIPTYECCSFIGNFAAFEYDHKNNKFSVAWNISTLPANQGWAGAGVWGSQPPIDIKRGQLFIATGNIYGAPPAEFAHCENSTASCLPSNIYQDAVLALDLENGDIKWSRLVSPLDAWTSACKDPSTKDLCPQTPGPDADFGMAPAFVPAALGNLTSGNDTVVIGQKNGIVFSMYAETGESQWTHSTSPDGDLGGLSWGMGVDASSIYFTAINYGSQNWTLVNGGPTVNNSAFGAMALKDGIIKWETPSPKTDFAYTPPTVVNDILLVGEAGEVVAAGGTGSLIALDKATGATLFNVQVDSVLRGGIAVQDQYVMFGTGYSYASPLNKGSFYVMTIK